MYSQETKAKHRNVLFRDDLGISVRTVCIDTLHTLYLGPVHDWISRVLWDVARENAYKVAGVGVTQTLPETCFRLRNDLQNFYKTYKRANPREDIIEMVDITPSMFGTSRSEKFGPVKAAEMKHMVLLLELACKVCYKSGRCSQREADSHRGVVPGAHRRHEGQPDQRPKF